MEKENIVQKIESVMEASKKINIFPRILGAVSYLGVLCLLPLFLKTKNSFVRFHVRQGIILFIAEIISTLVWIIPFFGWIIGFIGWILCFLLAIIALVRTLMGQEWELPVLKRFVFKIRF